MQGLGPNVGPATTPTESLVARRDNLNGFDSFTHYALPPNSLSNLDSPIAKEADTGTTARSRVGADRFGTGGNYDLYFSLEGSENIFRNKKTSVFASGTTDMGLATADDIDALALFRKTVKRGVRGDAAVDKGMAVVVPISERLPNGDGIPTYDPSGGFAGIDDFLAAPDVPLMTDLALFSLTPDSPSLRPLGLSAADVFITDFDGTWTLFSSAESLGLDGGLFNNPFTGDNLDALDSLGVFVIPEPTTLSLLAVGMLMAYCRRRAERRQNGSEHPIHDIPTN